MLLDRIKKWIPLHRVIPMEPFLSAISIVMGLVADQYKANFDLFKRTNPVCTGLWVDELASEQGLQRATDETCDQLKARMVNYSNKLTAQNIEDGVNALLTSFGEAPTATVVEWWEFGGYADFVDPTTFGAYADVTRILPSRGFYVEIDSGLDIYWSRIIADIELRKPATTPYVLVIR